MTVLCASDIVIDAEDVVRRLTRLGLEPELIRSIWAYLIGHDELLDILEKEGEAGVAEALREYQAARNRKLKEQEEQKRQETNDGSPCQIPEQAPPPADPGIPGTPAPESRRKKDRKKKERQDKDRRRKTPGRLGAEDFPGARVVTYAIGGDLCSGCECQCGEGRLWPLRPGKTVRYEASPLLQSVRHETEKLRCRACGGVFAAHLPAAVTEEVILHRATPGAVATSIVTRYGMGFPDRRLETLQRYQQCPLPTSTQWAISQEAFLRLKAFHGAVLSMAANADSLLADDAHCRVVMLQKEIGAETDRAVAAGKDVMAVRTGIQSTIVVAGLPDGNDIHLFLTGREHQGENCHDILQNRTVPEPPALTTDAAAKAATIAPFPQKCKDGYIPVRKEKPSASKQKTSGSDIYFSQDFQELPHGYCLQHLRLRFEEVEKNHPEKVGHVMGLLGQIFLHERHCRTNRLSAVDRLAYHQEHSAPIMDRLKRWCEEQTGEKRVEPNSDLGGAIGYTTRQWEGLTEFLRSKNVAIDTNPCERNVRYVILHRNNSLHYQTSNGAIVGDFFMSLVATCQACGANPLHYIAALVRFSGSANADPENWMPWNYGTSHRKALEEREEEWKEIDARRARVGYRTCIRLRNPDHDDSPPGTRNRVSSRTDLRRREPRRQPEIHQ